MLPVNRWLAGACIGALMLGLMGCGAGDTKYGGNPEGAEAKAGKEYTTEDANAAQPNRGAMGRASDGGN